MFDRNLGGAVDVGSYTGPTLNGKPLHDGNCLDGVFGCERCTHGARCLTTAQRFRAGMALTATCETCGDDFMASDVSEQMAWDERGVSYMRCSDCRIRNSHPGDDIAEPRAVPERRLTAIKCACALASDAMQFEHAGVAISALTDTERTVLHYIVFGGEPNPMPPALSTALAGPRPSVVHALELIASLTREEHDLAQGFASLRVSLVAKNQRCD